MISSCPIARRRSRRVQREGMAVTRHFVGRARELHMFNEALAAAADGTGRLITVVGEAGIGKTRLCREVAGHAISSGALVAWGSCWPDTGAPPLWPWQAVL